MGKFLKLLASALIAPALLTGCNTAGCTDNQNSLPLAGFYSMSTGEAISVDSIAVWGVGAPGDSLLLSASTSASQLYLPLRSSADETSFCFAYRQTALDYEDFQDTITISYTSQPWFISEDCGAGYRHTITSLRHTYHLIDSVGLTDSTVTNIDREIMRIYFRTADAGEGYTQ